MKADLVFTDGRRQTVRLSSPWVLYRIEALGLDDQLEKDRERPWGIGGTLRLAWVASETEQGFDAWVKSLDSCHVSAEPGDEGWTPDHPSAASSNGQRTTTAPTRSARASRRSPSPQASRRRTS